MIPHIAPHSPTLLHNTTMRSFKQYITEMSRLHVGGGNHIYGHYDPSPDTIQSLLHNSPHGSLRSLHWKEGKKHKNVVFDAETLHDEVIEGEGLGDEDVVRGHISYGKNLTQGDREHYGLDKIKDNHIVGEFTHTGSMSSPWVKKHFNDNHGTHNVSLSFASHVNFRTHDTNE